MVNVFSWIMKRQSLLFIVHEKMLTVDTLQNRVVMDATRISDGKSGMLD
jgi:hypothetical protein